LPHKNLSFTVLRVHNTQARGVSATILRMKEMRIHLSMAAMHEMAQGAELVLEQDGVRVILGCDDEAVVAFHTQVERALLHLLPVGGGLPN
jgi:hypothetical protein